MKIIKITNKDAQILKGLLEGALGTSESEEFSQFANRVLKKLRSVKSQFECK